MRRFIYAIARWALLLHYDPVKDSFSDDRSFFSMLFFDSLHDPSHPSYLSWAGITEEDIAYEVSEEIPY